MELFLEILSICLIILIFVWLFILIKYIFKSVFNKYKINKKELKIDISFWICMYFIISWLLFWFFDFIIYPYFSWEWEKFLPYFMDYSDIFLILIIELITVIIIIPIICIFINKSKYKKYNLKIDKYYYRLNLLSLLIAYILTIFIGYYTWMVEYTYFII